MVGSIGKETTYFVKGPTGKTTLHWISGFNTRVLISVGHIWRCPIAVICCITAQCSDCAQPIQTGEYFPHVVQTMDQNFLYIEAFDISIKTIFYVKSSTILHFYRNNSGLVYNLNIRQNASRILVKRMISQALT